MRFSAYQDVLVFSKRRAYPDVMLHRGARIHIEIAGIPFAERIHLLDAVGGFYDEYAVIERFPPPGPTHQNGMKKY